MRERQTEKGKGKRKNEWQRRQKDKAGNTEGGSIIVLLTSCLTGLESFFVFICKTGVSKPVKQEVNGTVILPPLVFPGRRKRERERKRERDKVRDKQVERRQRQTQRRRETKGKRRQKQSEEREREREREREEGRQKQRV